jgi:hypothetical protein
MEPLTEKDNGIIVKEVSTMMKGLVFPSLLNLKVKAFLQLIARNVRFQISSHSIS